MDKPGTTKTPYVSYAGQGVDVASKRADDLDTRCLVHLAGKDAPAVLDLGCGAGGQSVRMALAGARVAAVDRYDFTAAFAELRQVYGLSEAALQFCCADLQALPDTLGRAVYDDAVLQRTIHYLPYAAAYTLLQFLYTRVTGKLFISVTGMESAVGEGYSGPSVAPAERFFPLLPVAAETFSITEPICLYTKAEFVQLLEQAGWRVEECWTSAFGNHKAIAAHD